jgi:hypothetical protein
MQSATLHERMAGRIRSWAEAGEFSMLSESAKVNTRSAQGRGYPILTSSLMARPYGGCVLSFSELDRGGALPSFGTCARH